MDGFWNPINFLGIVGYPHDISEDAIDNMSESDHTHAGAHVVAFTKFIEKWCDPPIYEDVLMQLFVFTLCGERAMSWFHDSPDNTFKTIQDLLHAFLNLFGRSQREVHNELVDNFMETWRRKNIPNIKTISSDIEVDAPSNPIEELNEITQNIQPSQEEPCEATKEQFVAIEDQLEIIGNDFSETYIEYVDPHGLELDSEKFKEVHEEISDECMDESVIYFEEVRDLELENVEYLDDLSPHPPPDEPIFLKDNFENLEVNSMMVPVIGSSSVFQPEDKLMQNYVEMEGTFSLSMSYHYDNWLFVHLDKHEQQSNQILRSLSYSSVWLKGRRGMVLGWCFLIKSSKLIKLGKGSFVSHHGLGLFKHLWHQFTHSMGGCNVSPTLLCILILYHFNSLCQYVLRNFFQYHSFIFQLLCCILDISLCKCCLYH
jgi:hypothetical protein